MEDSWGQAPTAPHIVEAENGFVDVDDLKRGIHVVVGHKPTDTFLGLQVRLTTQAGYEVSETIWKDDYDDTPIAFSADRLARLMGERVQLNYNVWPENALSPTVEYEFGAQWYMPQIPAIRDGQVSWEDLDKGLEVIIRPYKDILVGDRVRVMMAGTNAGSSEIIETVVVDADTPLTVRFPAEKTRLTAGGKTTIFYQVDGHQTIPFSVSFYGARPVPIVEPQHMLRDSSYSPILMAPVEESGGYPFVLNFDTAPNIGDTVLVWALDDHNQVAKISEHTVSENPLTIYLKPETFNTSLTMEMVVVMYSNGNSLSSPRVAIELNR
ncbi:hypothetical protein [Pseudomonas putida]|uniref:hypothetical protein n=1 Tax=Pseudomonas putida TaxID=303 RepID=UPI0008194E4D|nr:hypothetical protein [Pseudomonas putida]OCT22514.1 hypothetical protein A6E24_16470 [Pseudomonas putida]OCT23555.1 hypothetical protein A6E23_16330 [Pseudomonas putida]OCT24730.1 hypothetical protein A6E20_12550 [Pseudomonas putida]OCT37548.1 hypothetical protein A6E19_15560 [Pseudomonas putida]